MDWLKNNRKYRIIPCDCCGRKTHADRLFFIPAFEWETAEAYDNYVGGRNLMLTGYGYVGNICRSCLPKKGGFSILLITENELGKKEV